MAEVNVTSDSDDDVFEECESDLRVESPAEEPKDNEVRVLLVDTPSENKEILTYELEPHSGLTDIITSDFREPAKENKFTEENDCEEELDNKKIETSFQVFEDISLIRASPDINRISLSLFTSSEDNECKESSSSAVVLDDTSPLEELPENRKEEVLSNLAKEFNENESIDLPDICFSKKCNTENLSPTYYRPSVSSTSEVSSTNMELSQINFLLALNESPQNSFVKKRLLNSQSEMSPRGGEMLRLNLNSTEVASSSKHLFPQLPTIDVSRSADSSQIRKTDLQNQTCTSKPPDLFDSFQINNISTNLEDLKKKAKEYIETIKTEENRYPIKTCRCQKSDNQGLAYNNILYNKLIIYLKNNSYNNKLIDENEQLLSAICAHIYKRPTRIATQRLKKFLNKYRQDILNDVAGNEERIYQAPEYKKNEVYINKLLEICITICHKEFISCLYKDTKISSEKKKEILKHLCPKNITNPDRNKLDNYLNSYKPYLCTKLEDFLRTDPNTGEPKSTVSSATKTGS